MGVKLMHEETAGKETGRERKIVERNKTWSRIYRQGGSRIRG